jgi:hypothetical protein
VHAVVLQLPDYLTRCLTNQPLEQSLSQQPISSSSSQDISHIIWNPQGHYRVCENQALVPILSQVNPAYSLLSCFFKNNFNIIILSMPWSPKRFIIFFFLYQNSTRIFSPMCDSSTAHLFPLGFVCPDNVWRKVNIIKLVVIFLAKRINV